MFALKRRAVVVLDIGKGQLSLAQFCRRGSGKFDVQHLASAAIEFGGPTHEQAGEQLSAFLRDVRARFRLATSVTVTLSAHLVLTKTIHAPAVDGPKRAKIVEFEASQAIPFPLDEVCWDWRVVAEHPDGLEVNVVAAKANLIRAILGAMAAARIDVERVVPSGVALRSAFRRWRSAAGNPALLVCIGRAATQLLYLDGERFVTRGLAFGFAAEAPNATALAIASDPFVQRLTSEIARSLVHFQQPAAGGVIREIHLCGEGPLAAMKPVLADAFACGVHVFDPLETLTVAGCREPIDASDRAAMGSLVGGALTSELSDDACLNLVPAEVRTRRALRRRQPALALAAGFAVLALVPPTAHGLRERNALRTELHNCDVEQQRLQAARQRGTAQAARVAAARHTAELLNQLETIRSAWPTFLADMEAKVGQAGDLWLDRLILIPANASAAAPRAPERVPVEIEISGRVIDRRSDPDTEPRARSSEQIRQLLANLRASSFVAAVRDERFESGGPGVLRFAMVLTLDGTHAL